jgi:hypothetical protein
MRATGTDSEHLFAAADQQNLFVTDMADQRLAILQLGEGNAFGQIGTRGFGFILRHFCLLNLCDRARRQRRPYPQASKASRRTKACSEDQVMARKDGLRVPMANYRRPNGHAL